MLERVIVIAVFITVFGLKLPVVIYVFVKENRTFFNIFDGNNPVDWTIKNVKIKVGFFACRQMTGSINIVILTVYLLAFPRNRIAITSKRVSLVICRRRGCHDISRKVLRCSNQVSVFVPEPRIIALLIGDACPQVTHMQLVTANAVIVVTVQIEPEQVCAAEQITLVNAFNIFGINKRAALVKPSVTGGVTACCPAKTG